MKKRMVSLAALLLVTCLLTGCGAAGEKVSPGITELRAQRGLCRNIPVGLCQCQQKEPVVARGGEHHGAVKLLVHSLGDHIVLPDLLFEKRHQHPIQSNAEFPASLTCEQKLHVPLQDGANTVTAASGDVQGNTITLNAIPEPNPAYINSQLNLIPQE